MSAHSSPWISTPWDAKRSGSTRVGSLPSCSRPSASASRFAGSIVTTATLRPRSAIPMASAAAVVVLPTPPEPAQMTIRLSRTSASTDVTTRTYSANVARQHPNAAAARSDQAFAHGEGDRLGAAARVELGHHVVQDVLDRALGVGELERHLARRMALGDQGQDLLLAVREPRCG